MNKRRRRFYEGYRLVTELLISDYLYLLQNTADDGANYTSLLYANGPGHKDRSNMTLNNEVANDIEYRQVTTAELLRRSFTK